MNGRGLNLLVFRDGRRRVDGADLKRALLDQTDVLTSNSPVDPVLAALLRAGELECGLADASACSLSALSPLTDCLADFFLGEKSLERLHQLRSALRGVPVPEELTVSAPEGFAFYAVHPLAYADVLNRLPHLSSTVIVLGIRSIGTTLSAVTAAAARMRGVRAERITVRPEGHPYNRQTEFSPREREVVQRGIDCGADFLIVDEGPGLSGSSFLSVAEAVEKAGVARERIAIICAHQPNIEALCSSNAAPRWRRFRCLPVAGEVRRPAEAGDFIGAGEWRQRLFAEQSSWPASWISMERLKYLSRSKDQERRLFKFAGLSHYGEAVIAREHQLAAAGFAPEPRRESDGFVSYEWLDRRPMTTRDLSAGVLARLAEYCAFRAGEFPAPNVDVNPLQQMADHNLNELGFEQTVTLRLERPAIADGRMQPHEWFLTADGQVLKTDCSSHGDDHFFPGPTDIAWDLAGAIVEWQMTGEQAAAFLDLYRRVSGDNAGPRISGFLTAYTVFRCAYCWMAANALSGTRDGERMVQAAERYTQRLQASIDAGPRTSRLDSACSLAATAES